MFWVRWHFRQLLTFAEHNWFCACLHDLHWGFLECCPHLSLDLDPLWLCDKRKRHQRGKKKIKPSFHLDLTWIFGCSSKKSAPGSWLGVSELHNAVILEPPGERLEIQEVPGYWFGCGNLFWSSVQTDINVKGVHQGSTAAYIITIVQCNIFIEFSVMATVVLVSHISMQKLYRWLSCTVRQLAPRGRNKSQICSWKLLILMFPEMIWCWVQSNCIVHKR